MEPARLGSGVVFAALALLLAGCGGRATPTPSTVVGTFVRWDPVDDQRGYAVFTLRNPSSTAATAKCRIRVWTDFGDFASDRLTGTEVPAGQTISRRVALTLEGGAQLVNHGEVVDC